MKTPRDGGVYPDAHGETGRGRRAALRPSAPTKARTPLNTHPPRFLALALVASLGCASRAATFRVTRPAMLNAAEVGNTMTVSGITTNNPAYLPAATEIVAELQGRITQSLNRSIRLLPQGGGVVIAGAVLSNDYFEEMNRNNRTCTRQVATGVQNGVTQYRTDTYPCTDLTRVGTGTSRIQFTLTNGQSNQVIFDQVFEFSQRETTTGVASPYENRTPNFINGDLLVRRARDVNVEHFAHVILPWQEDVTVEFEDCNGDNRCQQGYDLVRAGNLAAAEPLFTAVIGQYSAAGTAVPPNEAERVGEAFYNRGLVREYLGRHTLAVADFTRAIALRPGEDDWGAQLQDAQRQAREQEALRQQGAVSNETQNVQQAGTP